MAKLTIEIPDSQVQRVLDAFKESMRQEYDPDTGEAIPKQVTADDVRKYIISNLKQFVLNMERRKRRRELPQIDKVEVL